MSAPNTTDVWIHVKWRLQVLKICAFLMGMSFLDLRDLWYKITWVGPYDSFAFNAGSRGTLLPKPLPMDMTIPPSLNQSEWTSGWPSYHSRCETLTPFCSPGSTFFLNAMGTNCQVGVLNETKVLPQLVMTSNVRSDSMAWGACQMLFDHRKPGICQQHIVSKFLERYHMRAEPVPREWIAAEGSTAEAELLRFLELIAMSHPKWKLICTGGFDYTTPGRYYPTIFGCASPNLFRAEFVGVYATDIYRLQFDKAWLTAIDVVSFVGIQYNIRQNTINYFDMDEETVTSSTDDGSTSSVALSVTETTANNFVSRGLLYVLMIIIDILLLLSQMYTGLELVTEWIIPVMRKQDEKQFEEELQERLGADTLPPPATNLEDVSFSKEEYTSALSTSLYRNNVIVLLTVISQMISWGIIIPNSVIWTWSLSNSAKLQAFLGSLRLWTLILIGANALWDVVVFFFERHAYYFARATYVTSFEVMAIGAICAYSKSADVMAISEIKFDIEHQRVNDVFSFAGYIAHGNTFNEDLDYSPNSRAHLLTVMYMPLIAIVGWSIFGVFLWLLVKLVIYWILDLPVVAGWIYNVKKFMGVKEPSVTSVSSTRQQLNRKKLLNSAHMLDPAERVYKRVELEHMLNIPMRARSLIRATLSMQKVVRGEVIIRPPVHLDFGVLIRDRVVTARTGFRSTMRSMMQLSSPPVSKSTRIITMATINAIDFGDLGELKNQHPLEKQIAAKQRGNALGGKSYAAVFAAEE
ncbi:hypothetical protein Gpo141_00009202 [Globisporangium polare]